VPAIQPASPGHGNLLPVTGDYVLEYLDALKARSVSVFRVSKNAQGNLRADPVDPAASQALTVAERSQKLFLVEKDWMAKAFSESDSFDAQLEPLLRESPEERASAVTTLRTTLSELRKKEVPAETKAKAIMDTLSQVFLLNKASLKVKAHEVTVHEKSVARESDSIIGSALEMAEEPALMAGFFSCFKGLSNGQTINHVMRVFVSFTGFLQRFETLHQNRLSTTLRRVFPSVYLSLYRKILPSVDLRLMTSDQLLQLPDLDFLDRKEFSLGAFLHDIGKMGNIDYFESDLGFDAEQIQQHVYLGAGLILMNYGNSHDGARMMAGDHHNALGRPGGYGITRLERERGVRAPVETIRVLSSDPKGFVSGEALGWLPVEMLAVADVYDAMTDNSRTYKKAMTPAQAVVFLEDTMAAAGKLDPVLVDLYVDFLRTQNVVVPEDRGFEFKVKQAR